MSSELLQAIESLGREKGTDRSTVIEALEDAMAAAARKVLARGSGGHAGKP